MCDSEILFHTNKPPEINWTAHKSAWEYELRLHISALRFDLSSAMQGPGCTVNSIILARNVNSDRLQWDLCLCGRTLAVKHLISAELTLTRNRLKLNWNKLFLKQKQGLDTVCFPQTVVHLLCHGIAHTYAFSWWQMLLMWLSLVCIKGSLTPGGPPLCAGVPEHPSCPERHSLKLKCLFTNCKRSR